jgi:formyl-CoA transferase
MRVFDAIDRPDLKDDPRFATMADRLAHATELDAIIAGWMAARTRAEALDAFERHDAALAPLYDVAEFMDDPHVRARGSIATVDDPDWGPVRMQGVHPRMSATPGRIDRTGASTLGADNADVYGELGLGGDELAELKRMGAI